MQSKLKKKWVEALRSGKYEQGHSYLRVEKSEGETQDKFCCLGVLCDLEESESWRKEAGDWLHKTGENFGLPDDVLQKKWGLDKPVNRSENALSVADKLAEMNDEGKSFKQIANWIEKHL